MVSDDAGFKEIPFPQIRCLITDPLDASRKKNNVFGVAEINISEIRKEAKDNSVNFLSVMIYKIAKSVASNPNCNSYRKGRKKIIVFNDVDICVMAEREVDSIKLPLPYILRDANNKSLEEINEELNQAKTGDLNKIYLHNKMRIYLAFPKFMRILFWKVVQRNPHQFKKRLGTVALTAMHTKSIGKFYFRPLTPYTLTIALGGIYKNELHQEIMSLTVCIDHDILDGTDSIKFMQSLLRPLNL